MRFKAGDKVIDLATGKRAIVRSAEPRAGGGELYVLDLADGSAIVFRGAIEIAADAPPATV